MEGVAPLDFLVCCCIELRDEGIPNPDLLGLRRRKQYHAPRARIKITIPTAKKIPIVAGVLRRAFEECMLKGLALVDVLDAVDDTAVEPVEVVVDGEDMESGRDATANSLCITVAKEVKPEGVMVLWSTRTPAMLGPAE